MVQYLDWIDVKSSLAICTVSDIAIDRQLADFYDRYFSPRCINFKRAAFNVEREF